MARVQDAIAGGNLNLSWLLVRSVGLLARIWLSSLSSLFFFPSAGTPALAIRAEPQVTDTMLRSGLARARARLMPIGAATILC